MTITDRHEHCIKCGRRLYCTASKRRGYGWGCWRIVRAARRLAELAVFTAKQVEDAAELIEDAAIIPTALATVFRTVSSDGTKVYLTTRNGCTCPARKECFHRAGVIMVTA
jgi:hypothetical protein